MEELFFGSIFNQDLTKVKACDLMGKEKYILHLF